jgi:replicative DNA helicase
MGGIILENENTNKYTYEHQNIKSAADCLEQWFQEVVDSVERNVIPTGFPTLDQTLEGGLHEGLYCIGAISSLGKTTFALQMADQIAQSGRDVLIFSLEMARNELISKSLSRRTFIHSRDTKEHHMVQPKTVRQLQNANLYLHFSEQEQRLIEQSKIDYLQYGKNLFIVEGNHKTNTTQIKQYIDYFVLMKESYPVVIIDYLQILALTDEKFKDMRMSVDSVVWDLKELSRTYKIPVIVVSSFSRAGYDTEAKMSSFKESGGIEYTSDVLFGLQAKGAGEPDFDINVAKNQSPREIELVVLKNRNGITGDKLGFYYHPAYNYYHETEFDDGHSSDFSPIKTNNKKGYTKVSRR